MFIKLSFIFIINCVNAYVNSHSRNFADIKKFNCNPCAHLFSDLLITGAQSALPCIHSGQPLFKWPTNVNSLSNKCKIPTDIRSNDFSFDLESGIVFAKYRVCFLRQHKWLIHYEFKCTKLENWKRSTIEFRHKVFIYICYIC